MTNPPTLRAEDQLAFDELAEQVALGEGFQLLFVLAGSVEVHRLAERVRDASAALRSEELDYLVLDPYIGLGSTSLTLEHLHRWVLQPLLRSNLLHEARNPLVVIDMSSFRVLDSDREVWRQFLTFVNRQRNELMQAFRGTLVLVMEEDFAVEFAGVAPDLWSVRSGIARFDRKADFGDGLAEPRGVFAEQLRLRREVLQRGYTPERLRA
ncbi:MAG: hypothetical protein KC431_23040, partial [Myxococcales bacterium]|nr:hypothetical protein [Myxococcales bacterium]